VEESPRNSRDFINKTGDFPENYHACRSVENFTVNFIFRQKYIAFGDFQQENSPRRLTDFERGRNLAWMMLLITAGGGRS
jgi:hypothetical protein